MREPMSRALPMLVLSGLLAVATMASAADYTQAAGSSLVFAGSYQGQVFTGRFPGFSTRLTFDPAQLATSKLDVTIPLASATTANKDYDEQMRGDAFFDAGRYAQAHYVATKFRALGGDRYAADGILSLPPFHRIAGFSATTTLSRKAFGIDAWPGVIGDEVELRIEAEAEPDASRGDNAPRDTPAPADAPPSQPPTTP
jgi:polyisoprenoid-binding protein YceI